MREIILNGSIVLLVGSFAIGILTGEKGLAEISPFIVSPFKGVLCLFLLDMGLIAGRGLRQSKGVLEVGAVAFGMVMPLAGSAIGLLLGMMIGLSTGGVILLMVLAASASNLPHQLVHPSTSALSPSCTSPHVQATPSVIFLVSRCGDSRVARGRHTTALSAQWTNKHCTTRAVYR